MNQRDLRLALLLAAEVFFVLGIVDIVHGSPWLWQGWMLLGLAGGVAERDR